MTIRHIVLFKFSKISPEKEIEIQKEFLKLKSLPNVGVTNFGFNKTFTSRGF